MQDGRLALDGFAVAPVGRPGGRFSYSDTGYVIAARVLETCTGSDLAATAGPDEPGFAAGERMGLGVFRRSFGDRTAWGHGGFWGTRELHLPDDGVTLAGTNRDPAIDLRPTLLEPLVALAVPSGRASTPAFAG